MIQKWVGPDTLGQWHRSHCNYLPPYVLRTDPPRSDHFTNILTTGCSSFPLRVIAEWRTKDNLFGLPGGSAESSWQKRPGWNLGFYAQYDDISDTVNIGSRLVSCCFIGLVYLGDVTYQEDMYLQGWNRHVFVRWCCLDRGTEICLHYNVIDTDLGLGVVAQFDEDRWPHLANQILIWQSSVTLALGLRGASLGSRLGQILIRVGLTEPSHEGTTGTPWGD